MTIVTYVAIHPNPGVQWDEVQKQIKTACDLARKHGAENVTVIATMVGGPATNTIGMLATSEDWTRFGKVQQSLQDDPEMQQPCSRVARSVPGRRTSARRLTCNAQPYTRSTTLSQALVFIAGAPAGWLGSSS